LGYCKANITILEIVKVKKTLSRSGLMIHTMLVPALLIAPMFAVSASAQDSTASAEDDSTLVVVTGSRLKTRDIKAISPVSTVTSETITLTAAQSTERLLNELPQIVPGNTYTSNNAGGEDFATLDLRGLSPTRTLILVNGERIPGSSTTGAVDVSTIPTDLISKVELVTGGASAVYGSDAIAGVVNFVLKKNYQGAEMNASFGQSFEGHAPEFNINALVGGNFDNGKGNVTAYASYYEREGVFQSEFDYSKVSAALLYGYDTSTSQYTGSCIANSSAEWISCRNSLLAAGPSVIAGTWASGGSATPPWGTITRSGANAFNAATLASNPLTAARFASYDHDCNPATANIAYSTAGLSFNDAGQLTPQLTSGACAVPDRAAGSSRYNYAPDNNLIIPATRYTLFTTYNYELSPKARLNGQMSYVNSSSTVQLAATPATGLTITLTPAMQTLIQSAAPDLWVALQSRPNPLATFGMTYRTNAVGFRVGKSTNNSFFLLNTLAGEFNDNWDYSVTTSFGQNSFNQLAQNNVGATQLTQGLAGCQNPDGSAITGRLPGCVPLDIFGPNALSAAGINFLGVDTQASTTVAETRLSAFVRGSVFELPAGPVNTVFGYEFRKSRAELQVDDAQKNGDIFGFNAIQNQKGQIEVKELYTEISIPILRDMPFAESANLELGYRTSDYSTIGEAETYKIGADWSPVNWLRFRAAHNKAVRAPSVFELFQNGDQGFPSYSDPCRTTDAARQAFCITKGVPSTSYPGFAQINSQVQAFAFGNPDLKPETAKSDTVGFVFQPDWFPVGNLVATVDYYKISIVDAIGTRGAQTVLNSCYVNLGSAGQSASDCARITRDPVTGQVSGVNTSIGNVTFVDTIGTDISVKWSDDVYDGKLALDLSLSLLDSYNSGGTEFKGTTDGGIGGSTPDYKGILSATYKKGDFTYYGRMTYVPPMDQNQLLGSAPGFLPDTPEAKYFDATLVWNVNTNLSLVGNVQNLFDELPPQTGSGIFAQANTDVQTYRVLGRAFNISAKYKF
jgi:outer membrane receptor protein involved in Fe transport